VSDVGRALGASSPARVVFFGSGPFGVPILRALLGLPGIRLDGVVTLPDRPSGRHAVPTPTPVAVTATALGIAPLKLASVRTPEALAALVALRPDLGVLADFGRIVPPGLLDIPPLGILNVHPSLLPRHRGATPIAATILAGDERAGVSVIRMDEGLDTGPIVAAEAWPLRGDEAAPELEAEAATVGARLIARAVPAWLAGTIQAVPQPEAGATLTRPFTREDGRLDPSLPAVRLERMVRALRPWPGTFIETAADRLAVLDAEVGEASAGDEPGHLVAAGDGLALATADGHLRLLRVRPAGSRAMSGSEYRRGAGRTVAGTRVR
jgi:methionyl-tRNA formyltransferase